MIHGHGGNIYLLANSLGCSPYDIIDMSSNVNPIGPPLGLSMELREELMAIGSLPEVDSAELIEAFAFQMRVKHSCILAGNGTTPFIYLLPRALGLKRAAILSPTYSDYSDSCQMNGVDFKRVMSTSENDFVFDAGEVVQKTQDCDTVFICNPNNPTGKEIDAESLYRLCAENPDRTFIIDESYLSFSPDGEKRSMIRCCMGLESDLDNVVVLHSLSKIYRIPGLRIGFLVASERIIRQVAEYMMPWSVNSLAQIAGIHLLEHPESVELFLEETRELLETEKAKFYDAFAGSASVRFFDSRTSFILGELQRGYSASAVCEYLLRDRILIRNCSNFEGLSDNYIRISLKTPKINDSLIHRLKELFD
jgi:threonine-phosphate decarboxylase